MKEKKIKVAFFADILERDVDGAVRTMYQLIDRIPKREFEYEFYCGRLPKGEFPFRTIKVPSVNVPFNKNYQAALPQMRGITIVKSLYDFQPDVIHISTPSSLGFFALQYANNNNIPVLTIYHTHFISYIKYYFKRVPSLINIAEHIAQKNYKNFYNFSNLIYVPTEQMIEELSALGVKKNLMKLWERGIDLNLFSPDKKDRSVIKKITGNNHPTVFFASRLVWEKNLETLFNIYDIIQRSKLKINFIIAGTGAAENDAKARMKKAYFLGQVNHKKLSVLYASCDVLVFPSVSETYGNVVVEAMASGCIPVIARGGGSQSLVNDGLTGFLCEPDNAVEYVENVKEILKNKELRNRMKNAGYKYTSKLSWDNLAKTYFQDIKNLSVIEVKMSRIFKIKRFLKSIFRNNQWTPIKN